MRQPTLFLIACFVMRSTSVLFALLLLALPRLAAAQNWGTVAGTIAETGTSLAIPSATILVDGTNFGTATDGEGRYALRLPAGRYGLRFSSVGFEARLDSVVVRRDQTTTLNVRLRPAIIELEGLTVEDDASADDVGAYTLTPEAMEDIPAPFHDGLRALKALPGVASNNEMSYQYSVRGGGFNENLIFINGFEVYLPQRPRQGEQEGLSLLNPALASGMTLYTGGFPARYGGKLSSALDVRYRRPEGESLGGSGYLSLLDAGVATGASALDGRLGWTFGVRKAQASRFFSTQELKGAYEPDFTDVQGTFAYRLTPRHEIEGVGVWVDHAFSLDPRSRKTYFGTVSADPRFPSDLQSLWMNYGEGSAERDGYATQFVGLRLNSRLSDKLRVEHDVAYFNTIEDEAYNLTSSLALYQVDPGSGDPNSGAGHVRIGSGTQEDRADNQVGVRTWTGQSRWLFTTGRHAAEAGWLVRHLQFDDRLQEKSIINGEADGRPVRLVVDSLRGQATLGAYQTGFYVQDAVDVLPGEPGRFVVTAGLRSDYFSFNGEWTLSPRLSAKFRLSERTLLLGSGGVYHQAPTYRELRGTPVTGETIEDALNRDLKAQRSVQFVGGVEHFLPQRRFYLRAEAYYKHLTNLISYDIENVRVTYSGENDARGFAYGLDVQMRGEFVPGLESWVNYSYLVARERFLPAFQTQYNGGLIPRPADQRHTFSLFIQDYVPGDKTWKLHLRGLYGSGLPYTPPVPDESGSVTRQVDGPRGAGRFTGYRRVDMGATKEIVLTENGLNRPLRLQLTAELLNVFDMTNTVAHAWVPGGDGLWRRIPTHLTPRTLNVRLRVEF